MKRGCKLYFSFLIIVFTFLLASCGITESQVRQLSKIPTQENYKFVFGNGVTSEGTSIYFQDLIKEKIEKSGRKVSNMYFKTDKSLLIGDYLFFLQIYNSKSKYPDTVNKYVSGYIDLINLKVYIYKYYDDLEMNQYVDVIRFGNNIAYFDGKTCIVYNGVGVNIKNINLDGYELIRNNNQQTLLFQKINDNLKQYKIYDDKLNEYDFEIDDNAILLYTDLPYIIYYKYLNSKSEYYGLDVTNKQSLTEDEVKNQIEIQKSRKNEKYIKGKTFSYNILDNHENYKNHIQKGYLEIVIDEEITLISIDELKEVVPEIKKQQEIFNNREVYFTNVFVDNDEIYIAVQNDQSFFGFNGNETLPIVIKYDYENKTYSYIGYYGAVYYKLIKVYKLD